MEPIRLWRIYCDGWNYTDDEEVSKIGEPIAALPRAEYDALVARTEKPLDHVMRTSCGHEWTVRHTACPRCFDALRAERDSLVKERDEATLGANEMREEAEDAVTSAERYMIERDAATARADAVEEAARELADAAEATVAECGLNRTIEALDAAVRAYRAALDAASRASAIKRGANGGE